MRTEPINSLKTNQGRFGAELSDSSIEKLADYYELLQEHNPILHLVGPSSPSEFATRHILESLTLLPHLPLKTKFADVGTGGGLPSIPCLLVREDLTAILIESKEKKTKFLEEAVEKLGIKDRVTIVTRQFEEAELDDATVVTCRALDKFSDKLRKMVRWSKGRQILFFAGENLAEVLTKNGLSFERSLMPLSERRFLFILDE